MILIIKLILNEYPNATRVYRFLLTLPVTVATNERILYYLDKVSAHIRSLNLILKCLYQRQFDYGEIYKSIQ
jgi:hypothetical protein